MERIFLQTLLPPSKLRVTRKRLSREAASPRVAANTITRGLIIQVVSIAEMHHLDNNATTLIMNMARSLPRVPGSMSSGHHDLKRTDLMQPPPNKEKISKDGHASLIIRPCT
jgi:hypothetical protein